VQVTVVSPILNREPELGVQLIVTDPTLLKTVGSGKRTVAPLLLVVVTGAISGQLIVISEVGVGVGNSDAAAAVLAVTALLRPP